MVLGMGLGLPSADFDPAVTDDPTNEQALKADIAD